MSLLEQPVPGMDRIEIGGLIIDQIAAGAANVKRVIYPPGWSWRASMQEVTGTGRCRHAHVGFLAQGTLSIRYADGCEHTYRAPEAVVIEADHDAWVEGAEPTVLIQVDTGPDTIERLGLGDLRHACAGPV